MHIAVAGNIGAGKTTLTHLLSKHYRWEAHFEDVVDNPYLDDFYTQMERWSFNLQIYFLNSRYTFKSEITFKRMSLYYSIYLASMGLGVLLLALFRLSRGRFGLFSLCVSFTFLFCNPL